MAYNELIKNFEKIRNYMRQFYVYGFKSRSEYDSKSARSYDNERRRLESWLGDYMSFRQDADGKRVFLSVDSRSVGANPLYNAFKARSFTAGDITFHFYILDLLNDGRALSVSEIVDAVAEKYLSRFDSAAELDESTVRKKLREYVNLGILRVEKRGRELVYSRNESLVDLDSWRDAASFFSEENPLGVVGSYLLDKFESTPDYFRFKHHYILHALDSGILYEILSAIGENRSIEIEVMGRRVSGTRTHSVFPMRIFVSTQTGRQYLLCFSSRFRKPTFYRLDTIVSVKAGEVAPEPELYDGFYEKFRENLWGVSTGVDFALDHIEMTVRVEEGEEFIVNRLHREKRFGTVTQLDERTYLFSADVYDASEMMPWIRTFIGRIGELVCSNEWVMKTFYDDLEAMSRMYGGDADAV